MMDKADDRVEMFPAIRRNQGWVIQLVLNENVKSTREPKPQVIRQVRGVVAPGERYNFRHITLRVQIFNQFAVIQISATESLQRTVDEEADVHEMSLCFLSVMRFDYARLGLRQGAGNAEIFVLSAVEGWFQMKNIQR
jgi:hypothetical protein